VAERIVDELEAIEIEEEQGHRLAVALRVVSAWAKRWLNM